MRGYGVAALDEIAIGVSAIRTFSMSFVGIGFSFFYMYYMQTIKWTTYSLQICSLEGFLSIVPIAFIMSKIFELNGIWISYIHNEMLAFLFIVIKSRIIVKRSKGELFSIFLFKKDTSKNVK